MSNPPHFDHSTYNSPSSPFSLGSANPEIGGSGTSSSVVTGPNIFEGSP